MGELGVNEYEQALQAVRDIYVNYPKRIESNEQELTKIEQEIQDLLHVIELGSYDAIKGNQLLKQLKKARQDRRKIKNDLELLEPVKEFISYAKPTEKNIGQSIGKLRNVINVQEHRTYRMRVRTDLQEWVK